MKKLTLSALALLIALPCFAFMKEKHFSVNLNADIQKQQIREHQFTSFKYFWHISNNNAVATMSGSEVVTFLYSQRLGTNATSPWIEVVTGEVFSATGGIVAVQFNPANVNTNGSFTWKLSVSSNGVDIMENPWGDMWLIPKVGGGGTNGFPTSTSVVNLAGQTFLNDPWVESTGDFTQLTGLGGTTGQVFESNGDGTGAWRTPAGSGDMLASVYDPIIAVISNRADGAETTNAAQQTTINTLTSQVAGAEITNAAQAVTIVALTATNAAQQTTIDALSTTQATQQTEIDANQLTNTTQQATLNTWTASSNLFLKLSGGTMSGNLNMGAQTISNAPTVTTGTNVTFFMKSAVNGTNSVYFTVGSTNQYHFLTPFN